MMELFFMGGPLFMGMLTIVFVAVIAVTVLNGLPVLQGKIIEPNEAYRKLSYIKSVGLFALVLGILGQLIGLFDAFKAIQSMEGGVSPAILAGGLRVSMITTLYGAFIYLLSLLIWFGFSLKLRG